MAVRPARLKSGWELGNCQNRSYMLIWNALIQAVFELVKFKFNLTRICPNLNSSNHDSDVLQSVASPQAPDCISTTFMRTRGVLINYKQS